jgi:transposase-like protein
MAIRRPMESEERAEIISLLKKGNISHREISRRFNRSQSTISKLARDANITPVNRRKRTPAAEELEGSFTREERINVADSAIGVISGLLKSGGLSPKDLRETTASLKTALEARRMEDIEPDPEEKKQDATVWLEEFATPGESRGIGLDLNTEVGRRMYAFGLAMEEAEDIDDWGALRKKEQEIIDEMKAKAKAAEEGSDDG